MRSAACAAVGEVVSLTRLFRAFVLILGTGALLSSAGAWPRQHSVQKVRVHVLANSTLLRTNWGSNEDTYLAELLFNRNSESVLVRLVDAYPNEAPPLSKVALTSPAGTVLRVKRDRGCDSAYSSLLLRSAPGDSMAMLPVKLNYQPKMDHVPEPDAALPCYRVERR